MNRIEFDRIEYEYKQSAFDGNVSIFSYLNRGHTDIAEFLDAVKPHAEKKVNALRKTLGNVKTNTVSNATFKKPHFNTQKEQEIAGEGIDLDDDLSVPGQSLSQMISEYLPNLYNEKQFDNNYFDERQQTEKEYFSGSELIDFYTDDDTIYKKVIDFKGDIFEKVLNRDNVGGNLGELDGDEPGIIVPTNNLNMESQPHQKPYFNN